MELEVEIEINNWKKPTLPLGAQVAEMTAELSELRHTYQLMSDASRRAASMWREAHPGAEIWPDMAQAEIWLLEQNERLAVQVAALTERMKVNYVKVTYNGAPELDTQMASITAERNEYRDALIEIHHTAKDRLLNMAYLTNKTLAAIDKAIGD
jgi:hypothetical protein